MNSYKILPVFIPFAGCARRCVYCNQTTITGISLTDKELLDCARRQIDTWRAYSGGYTEIAFYGGTFTRLCASLRRDLYKLADGMPLRVSTCPDSVSDEFLSEIPSFNIRTVELGVQSLSEKVLLANNRTYSAERTIEVFQKLAGLVKTSAQLMTGMYMENRKDVIHTGKMLQILGSDFSRIYPTIVFTETGLAGLYERKEYSPPPPEEIIMRTTFYYACLLGCSSKIIRIGLPPEINGDKIVAGFWHPSLGDIVKTVFTGIFCLRFGVLPDICSGYAGYKGFIKKNFSGIKTDSAINSYQTMAQILLESYSESEQWFAEEPGFDIARGLIG